MSSESSKHFSRSAFSSRVCPLFLKKDDLLQKRFDLDNRIPTIIFDLGY